MKKILTTILAFVYLSGSMGATIHLHYCMGKLASWGLIDHESTRCARCGMVKKNPSSQRITSQTDCCRDEHKRIQTDKEQKLSPEEIFKYIHDLPAFVFRHPYIEYTSAFAFSKAYSHTRAPSLQSRPALFVQYCNFLI